MCPLSTASALTLFIAPSSPTAPPRITHRAQHRVYLHDFVQTLTQPTGRGCATATRPGGMKGAPIDREPPPFGATARQLGAFRLCATGAVPHPVKLKARAGEANQRDCAVLSAVTGEPKQLEPTSERLHRTLFVSWFLRLPAVEVYGQAPPACLLVTNWHEVGRSSAAGHYLAH